MFACNMCSSADPTSDTVKVNFSAVAAEDADKENQPGANQMQPKQLDAALKDRAAQEEEERRRAEAEAERVERERRLQEQKKRQEQEAAAARRAEDAARQAAAEAQRRAEAEEQARHMQRVAADVERKRMEEMEMARKTAEEAEARRKAEEAEQERQLQEQVARDKAKLEAFLKEHGYTGANAKRTKMFKSKYPLHTAVKINDPDMVRILLASGADAGAKNSAGQTPAQLAKKSDKQGSHAGMLLALDGV